jgi:UDP-N-acetylglucosamine 2-epimerase (non-hydrolysing)
MSTILLAVGTRPEIIKMAPVIKALKKNHFVLVHTGQHYDYNLSLQFIKELNLIEPDETFALRSRNPTLQISEMIAKLHKIFSKLQRPNVVVTQGDTNSTMAAGIAALKSKIKLAHIEAGLRSYDWRMPEEHNRIAVDHISDLLFAPTKHCRNNLLKENVHGTIRTTGNTVIDAVAENIAIARKKSTINIPYDDDDFALFTLHRAENVDHEGTLINLINALIRTSVQIIFPIHPRTVMRLKMFRIYDKVKTASNIHIIPPVGYFDFLVLMQKCRFLITDSGGIQEEVTSPLIRKHVVLLRKSTERQEAVEAGFVKVVGTKERNIIAEIEQVMSNKKKLPRSSPFGDGQAGKKIAKLLLSYVKL